MVKKKLIEEEEEQKKKVFAEEIINNEYPEIKQIEEFERKMNWKVTKEQGLRENLKKKIIY